MPLQDANPTPSFGGFGLRCPSVRAPRMSTPKATVDKDYLAPPKNNVRMSWDSFRCDLESISQRIYKPQSTKGVSVGVG